jgi:hypothetical protein
MSTTDALHFQHSCTIAAPHSAQVSGNASGRGALAELEQSGLEQIARWTIASPSRDVWPAR